MRLVARKGKFVCVGLTLILSGSLSTAVVFADDESKTVPARDEQRKTRRYLAARALPKLERKSRKPRPMNSEC